MDNESGSFWKDLTASLPSNWQVEETSALPVEPLADLSAEVKAHLADPLATMSLADLTGPTTRVVIVCDEPPTHGTRATVLRSVLAQLERAGAGADPHRITLLIATATTTQPGNTPVRADGDWVGIANHVNVVQHNPNDLSELDELGNFEGVPLTVNYRAAEADLLIAISVMQLDDAAFDTGSTGTLTNRLMSAATVRELHTTRFYDDRAEPSAYARPLFERVVREGARRAGLVFAIDAIDDAQGCAVAVRAGAPNAVNDALMQVMSNMREASAASSAYDIVLVDTGATQGLFDASTAAIRIGLARNPVLMRGGSLILMADAANDTHNDSDESRAFYDALSNATIPDQVILQLQGRSLQPGEDRAYLLAQVMQRNHVIVAGAQHDQLARASHFLSTPTVREAAELAESFADVRPKALIVRNASRSIPAFGGSYWGSDSANDRDSDRDPIDDALIELTW